MSDSLPPRPLGHAIREAYKAVRIIGAIGLLLTLPGVLFYVRLLFQEPSKQDRARTDLQALESSLEQYTWRTGQLPRTGDWPALVKAGVLEREPVDPWNNPYRFSVAEDGRGRVTSLGADGQPGGEGEDQDLVSLFQVAVPSR